MYLLFWRTVEKDIVGTTERKIRIGTHLLRAKFSLSGRRSLIRMNYLRKGNWSKDGQYKVCQLLRSDDHSSVKGPTKYKGSFPSPEKKEISGRL